MSLELYTRFTKVHPASHSIGTFMPYGWIDLPERLDMTWLVYRQMLEDFARELANNINAFTLDLQRMTSWAKVLDGLDIETKHQGLTEFVDGPMTLCLLRPYALRSRFIFATAHLCHQLNMARDPGWTEDRLPADDEIYFEVADLQGRGWKSYNKLKRSLEKVGGKSFREATRNFRNLFTHQFAPRIGIGITNSVTRTQSPSGGATSYGIGGTPPLDLDATIQLLMGELNALYLAFEQFQLLVGEHGQFITERQAEYDRAREAASAG